MTVWANPNTGTIHRDPGCRRVMVSAGARGYDRLLAFAASPRVVNGHPTKRCAYCYSAAGYARYP